MATVKKLKKIEDDLFSALSKDITEDINLGEVVLRIGGKICKLSIVSDSESDTIVDNMKREYREKVSEKLSKIGELVNTRLQDYKNVIDSIRNELTRKESEYASKLINLVSMPDITWEHAKCGLSVVRGSGAGSLRWIARRTYNPRYIDRKPLKPAIVKKMTTPVIIVINTTHEKVTKVAVRKIGDLTPFMHYHHSGDGDCWGDWYPKATWESPYDIISIADDAIAVLENINTLSIGERSPRGLPRLDTVKRNISTKTVSVAADVTRSGEEISDIWSN